MLTNFETCDIVRTAQNVLFVFYSLLAEKRPGKKESSADGILFLQKDKIRMHFREKKLFFGDSEKLQAGAAFVHIYRSIFWRGIFNHKQHELC